MNNHSAEDYLDKLLNSVNGEEIEEEEFVEEVKAVEAVEEPEIHAEEIPEAVDVASLFEANDDAIDVASLFDDVEENESIDLASLFDETPKKNTGKQMHSRRVSKSEADFLMEFEAELEGEDFDDFLKHFDDEIVPQDKLEGYDIDNTTYEDPLLETPVAETTVVEELGVEAPTMEEPTETVSLEEMFFGGEAPAMENPAFEEPAFDTSAFEESAMDIPVAEDHSDAMDSFSLGGVDLGALLNETSDAENPLDNLFGEDSGADIPAMDTPADEGIGGADAFADLFGEAAVTEGAETSDDDVFANLFGGDGSGDAIDLSNMGEADLMSLLSGDGDLSDIGDMLSQDETGAVNGGELDAFSAFAESEMAGQLEQSEAAEGAPKKKGAKAAKGGFLGRLSSILAGLMGGDDEEDEPVALKKDSAPNAAQLSGENDDILASLDALEEKPAGKKEKKKEKKKKEKKEKKPKEKKPKKEKAPKPKKEKKPKEVDNTPPLPRGPVLMIWLMVGSLFALVLLGVNLTGYAGSISAAKSYHNNGEYAAAFAELDGLKIKEKDMALYNQVATLAPVDSELNAYYVFLSYERYEEALDSLICAAGRVELNEDGADVYECIGQMEILKKEVSNELEGKYGMTYEEALEMYHIKDRDEYTIALYEKLEELGLIED